MTHSRNTVIARLLSEYERNGQKSEATRFFQRTDVRDEIRAGLRDARELNAELAEARRVDHDLLTTRISV